MSSDTMYFNSSRLMSTSGKNKTNSIARLDKKRVQADKKNKVRQENSDVPQIQTLPNGGKPDFGHSSSRRKKREASSEKRSSSAGSKHNDQRDADRLSKNLKQLFIEPENTKVTAGEVSSSKSRPSSTMSAPHSSSGSNIHSSSPTVTNAAQKPLYSNGVPLPLTPDQHLNQNTLSSPLLMHPGLFPAPPPHSSAPQQSQLGAFGYPYGNYSLTSAVAPQFMNPQAPLVNPMYPQPPLAQLPLMYKALDIQQQQQYQQYQQSLQNNGRYQQQSQQPQQHQQHQHFQQPQNNQQYQQHSPSQYQQGPQSLPYLNPPMASYPKSSETTAIKPLSKPEKPKTGHNQKKQSSTSFAGASFASSDPKVHKLPKPSFAKA